MPIFNSLGALTYSRGEDNQAWKYWHITFPTVGQNATITTTTFDSTDNIYIGGSDPNSGVFMMKISLANVGQPPNIVFNRRIDATYYHLLKDYTGNSIISLQGFNAGTGFVYQRTGFYDKSNGNLLNSWAQNWGSNVGNTPAPQRTIEPLNFVVHSDNSYSVIGITNPAIRIGTTTYDNNQVYITKFNSSSNIVFMKNFVRFAGNANTASFFDNFSIGVDDNDNYLIACNPTGNTGNSANLDGVIANINSTGTTINWQKTLQNNGNNLTIYSAITANNNTYVIAGNRVISNSSVYLSKVDSTGNINWSKEISIGVNQVLESTKIAEYKGNLFLYDIQYTTVFPENIAFLFNIDSNTGNLNWQRSLSYTNNVYTIASSIEAIGFNEDKICIAGEYRFRHKTFNTTTARVRAAALPIDGGILANGVYNLISNAVLVGNTIFNYAVSNVATISNVILTTANANYTLVNPFGSEYNSNTHSVANSNVTTQFNRLS